MPAVLPPPLFSFLLFSWIPFFIGCRDVSSFSNAAGEHYEGAIGQADFIRAGIAADTRLCLTLDGDRLQSSPGKLTSSDGRLSNEPLRPIPQLWHDALSTLSFGEGRMQNFIYGISIHKGDAGKVEAVAVLSLLQSGEVEVRLLHGAPALDSTQSSEHIFGSFRLQRQNGLCSF